VLRCYRVPATDGFAVLTRSYASKGFERSVIFCAKTVPASISAKVVMKPFHAAD